MTRVIERSFHTESAMERQEWVDAITGLKHSLEGAGDSRGSRSSHDTRAMSFIGGRPEPADISMDSFEMLKVLGKGSFGKVMLAKLKSSGAVYAIKVLKKSMILEKNELAHTFTENSVLAKCSHPFLTSLHYSFQTPDLLCFVMEYVNGGELFFHLRKEKKFSEDRTRIYIAEILLALTYLHDQGIIYRDLKLENLLLDAEGHIKITDFGLCKEEITYGSTTRTFCGTPEYLAPEVILDSDYGLPVDWWGLGIVMFEMLSGKLPFNSHDYEELFELIITQEVVFPPIIGDVAQDLIGKLLHKDPAQRIGGGARDGHEIQEHPWFASVDFDKLYRREIPAPFVPQVKSATDVSNFDDHFTSEAPRLTPPKPGELDATSSSAFKDFDTIKPQADLS
ncbi:AGC/AKT protein kinase [Salpingoeca rosetta]|uniref:AGC/AKT protein kinase n=1 Tax=Salpingoeca rosetta (strain ATCC 50818 / BSB-021) TaxID=946362 RepID=F2UTF2_SALR5|nr:AGC/AKT protein kinase [Salpingoeca rosetta]EGD82834.1 AGC/AKT protein kinase [Salpingoeca rosetta]|eukprot:XP_004987553.1 AGC/AKT protein kinase [Salpingoeca rosetta]